VQPFATSYWAFTFGLTAMAFDAMKLVERGVGGMALPLAYATFAIANIAVATVAIGTLRLLVLGRVLPPPSSPITA
jgi:tellurite resistance protein